MWAVRGNQIDSLKIEANKQSYDQEKVKIETVYIPEKLDQMTTDQLCTVGANLWGE